MVDPNRKINRLTEKDIEFLDECEELFSTRYTNEDEEFVQHCLQPLPGPPIVENWNQNGSGAQHYNPGQRNYRGGGTAGGWNRRGGGYRNNNRRHHENPSNAYRHRRNYHQASGSHTHNQSNHEGNNSSESGRTRPMNYRKDYGNFVAARSDQ